MTLTAAPTRRLRVGRETVVDAGGRVVGYELLFRPAAGDASSDRDAATSSVINAAFAELGPAVVGSRRQLYVNAPRDVLTTDRELPFSPQHVVLEVLGGIEVDDAVVDGVLALKRRGFRVAVDGWATGPAFPRLLPVVDVVKVDLADLAVIAPEPGALADFVVHVHSLAPTALLLADGVDDADTLRRCRTARFDLFQGPHFHLRSGKRSATSVSQLTSLRLLAALCDPDSNARDIERIVSTDAGLSLRVLGAANSVAGASRQVSSLSQALVLVGPRKLGAWVVLGAFRGRSDGGREECVQVLTRARTCELLAHGVPGSSGPDGYAAGLVSGVVDLTGADPAAAVRACGLTPAVAAAVLRGEGTLGELLRAVGEFDRTGATTSARFATETVARAHLHALGTAVATVDSLTDG